MVPSNDSINATDLYAGLTLTRLQAFVAVADHGGFSAAAAYLALGQSTISFHVKALERVLNARLIVYRERRVHLTTAGQELYRVASNMLRDTERLAAAVRNIDQGQAGALRVGASMAFELAAFFERVVAPFRREHPLLQLALEFGHSVRLAEAVHEDRLDLAYVLNWRLPADVRYEPLHQADFTLMVAPQHPLARVEVVSEAQVYEAGLIAAPLYSQEWPHYEHLLREAGLRRFRLALEIDGVHARLLATQAGLGVMGVFVPPYAAKHMYLTLHPIQVGPPPPRVEFGLVSRNAELWTQATAQFVNWLRKIANSDTASSMSGGSARKVARPHAGRR
ncbi:MAG: LysR family transcriptional regulator [Chloroflexi bacterium]|nr:LysR family transcriptional regulator [Chloroflexota bacterium]